MPRYSGRVHQLRHLAERHLRVRPCTGKINNLIYDYIKHYFIVNLFFYSVASPKAIRAPFSVLKTQLSDKSKRFWSLNNYIILVPSGGPWEYCLDCFDPKELSGIRKSLYPTRLPPAQYKLRPRCRIMTVLWDSQDYFPDQLLFTLNSRQSQKELLTSFLTFSYPLRLLHYC